MIQAKYGSRFGITLRINGKSRPASLDEIEQTYSQRELDRIMEAAPGWVTLEIDSPLPAFPRLNPITSQCILLTVEGGVA